MRGRDRRGLPSYEIEHPGVRRRRELRHDLPARRRTPAASGPTRTSCSTGRTPAPTTSSPAAAAASAPRSTSTLPAPCSRSSTRTSIWGRVMIAAMSRSGDDARALTTRESARDRRCCWPSALAARRDCSGRRAAQPDSPRPSRSQSRRHRLHLECRRGDDPDVHSDDPGRLHQPARRHDGLHVRAIPRGPPVPAPGPRPVRQRGRHGHGDPPQRLHGDTPKSARRSRSSSRARRTSSPTGRRRSPSLRWRRRADLAGQVGPPGGGSVTYSFVARRAGTYLYESGGGQKTSGAPSLYSSPRSRSAWACSGR